MMMTSAQIETDRLTLRVPELSDFDPFAAMWGDESVNKYISGKVFSRDASWGKFKSNVGQWVLMGYGNWSIIAKHSGDYLGQVGFFDGNRGLGKNFDTVREAGWVMNPAAGGKGYATEAVQAAHIWMDQQPFGGRTVCMMSPDHIGSQRVAEKCGYVEMGRGTYEDTEVVMLERTA